MTNKNNPPTLSDVAELANVSKAAASRALSGKNRPVSAEKKTRILAAAETLGYVANPFAQSLANSETGLVAIVVNHIADMSDLNLFDSLIQGIQSIGKQALFVRLKSAQDIAELQKNAFLQRVDAVLIFSDLIEPKLAGSLFFTNNVIMLNGKSEEGGYSVKIDEEKGITDAVHYAKSVGIKRALLIGGRQSSETEKTRLTHYQKQFMALGIELEECVYCNYSYDEALDYLSQLGHVDSTQLGIFCSSDSMAMAAVDHFRKDSKQEGDSHHIFGFDNTEFSRRGAYQFSTIGYDKSDFVDAIITIVSSVGNAVSSGSDQKKSELSTANDDKKRLPITESHSIIETQFYLNQ